MSCSSQLIELLRSVASVRSESPTGREPGFEERVQAEKTRLYPRSHPSTIALVRAVVSVCDECEIEVADVAEDEGLRDAVIDMAMPVYWQQMQAAGWADA